MTQTAVVILNYNGRELLQKFLPSILNYSASARIIVADNCSTDQSIALLEKEFPTVDLIRIPENRGYCGGYNFAMLHITEKYCVLINSDIEVTEGWLEPLIDLLEADAKIGAVQPKLLAYNDKSRFEYAGAAGGKIDILGYPFCRGRVFNELEKDTGQYNISERIFWASGACFVIRTELFHAMGGLDEDFFAHMEEIDLCWKLNREGYKIYYQGQSTVYHVGGGTLAKSNPKKTYLNFRNGLSLIFKHWTAGELIFKFPTRILLDWFAALKFLLIDKSSADAAAVIRAHYHFVTNFSKEVKKRKRTSLKFPSKKVTALISPISIVVKFFLQGRKTYREIMAQ
jgi:hypothetical protein